MITRRINSFVFCTYAYVFVSVDSSKDSIARMSVLVLFTLYIVIIETSFVRFVYSSREITPKISPGLVFAHRPFQVS